MASVEERVKQIIVEQLGVDEAEVTPTASFVDDLGADSLDQVELVMAFEEAFGIEVPDEDAEKMTASLTVVIFSASSSGTSMPKASSNAITNSTWSSESAPKSSTKDAVGVTSASSTPSCSTIICFTRSSTLAIPIPPRSLIALTVDLCLRFPGLFACTMRAEYSRAKIVGLDPSEQPAHSIYPAPQGQLNQLMPNTCRRLRPKRGP